MLTLESLLASLDLSEGEAPVPTPWFELPGTPDTAQASAFFERLWSVHTTRFSVPSCSQLGNRINLFHELFQRHPHATAPALRWYDPTLGWCALTYAALLEHSARVAGEWASEGVRAGAQVLLILPVGPELLMALAAGFRLGVKLVFLPPLGARYLKARLAQVSFEHVVCTPGLLTVLPELAARQRSLQPRRMASPTLPSHAYGASEGVLQVFSPLKNLEEGPVELTAERLLLHALRDALLIYRLRPGDALAAPGFHPLLSQPFLLLATLLSGGTFVQLEPTLLGEGLALLGHWPLRAVGVSGALVHRLLSVRQPPTLRWDAWFFNPDEPLAGDVLQRFVRHCGLEQTPVAPVVLDPALGGAALLGIRRPGRPTRLVVPVPGTVWQLHSAPGASALTVGLLAEEGSAELPFRLLARSGVEWAYVGALGDRRHAWVYPSTALLALANEYPAVRASSVVFVPAQGESQSSSVVLVLFGGALEHATARPVAPLRSAPSTLLRQASAALDEVFVPDRVEVFPLHPQRVEGSPDSDWVQRQLLLGLLQRKRVEPLYQTLGALREVLVQRAARAAA